MDRETREDLAVALVYALVVGAVIAVILVGNRDPDELLARPRSRRRFDPSTLDLQQVQREISWMEHGIG